MSRAYFTAETSPHQRDNRPSEATRRNYTLLTRIHCFESLGWQGGSQSPVASDTAWRMWMKNSLPALARLRLSLATGTSGRPRESFISSSRRRQTRHLRPLPHEAPPFIKRYFKKDSWCSMIIFRKWKGYWYSFARTETLRVLYDYIRASPRSSLFHLSSCTSTSFL